MKICSKCKVEMDESNFTRSVSNKDGLVSKCRKCVSEYNRKYLNNSDNRKRVQEGSKKWRSENKDERKKYREDRKDLLREQKRAWESKPENRERSRERTRKYAKANPDKIKIGKAVWQKNNKEKIKRASAQQYRNNAERYRKNARDRRVVKRDYIKKYMAEWNAKNPDKLRAHSLRKQARKKNAGGTVTSRQLAARVAYYGGLCYVCGTVANAIDHVIPLARGGTNWPANLRPACTSCNSRKGARISLKELPEFLSLPCLTQDAIQG